MRSRAGILPYSGDEVHETVIDVVHRHHRGRTAGGVCDLFGQPAFDLCLYDLNERSVSRAMSTGEQKRELTLVANQLIAQDRAQIEPNILGIVGQSVGEFFQGHSLLLRT
jgi:hypothetical protein